MPIHKKRNRRKNEKLTKGPEVALLTRTELDWLNGNIQLSYAYQRKIKTDIKKKNLNPSRT